MKKKYIEIILSVIPVIIFLIIYKISSFRIAIIVGFLMGIIVYTGKYIYYKKITSFDYLGIFGLVVQSFIGLLAKNPKTYFIYPLVESSIYFLVFSISLIINNDIISRLAKDYAISEEGYERCRPTYRTITFIWVIFYLFKVAVKIIGITSWSFEVLFSVDWLLGTPGTLILIWFSFSYPYRYYEKKYGDT